MIEQDLHQAWQAIQTHNWDTANKLLAPYAHLAPALHLKGLMAYAQGQIQSAIEHWQSALLQGGLAEIYGLLAQAHMDLKQMDKAARAYQQLQDSGHALSDSQAHQLARAYFAQAQFEQALTLYHKLHHAHPRHSGLALELGNTYVELKDYNSAQTMYQQALELDPQSEKILFSLARLAFLQREFKTARQFTYAALEQNDRFLQAWYLLGSLQQQSGQIQAACLSFEQACRLAPDDPTSWNHLGLVYQALSQADKAQRAYHKALELQADHPEVKINLALSLRDDNQSQAALTLLDSIDSFQALYLQACTLPIILADADEALQWQEHLHHSLQRCLDYAQKNDIRIQDPMQELGRLPFYLPYLGIDDCTILQRLSKLWLTICPDLNWQAPHIHHPVTAQRWRIGIFSAHLRQHTVKELFGYLLTELDPQCFDVIGFYWGNPDDLAAQADPLIVIPTDLKQARAIISEFKLDLALYLDIGMEPFGYFLAYSRLARRQLVTWGHPISTGIPSLDAYLSCPDLDLEPAQTYSEPLLMAPAFFGNWHLPELPDTNRADFGLPPTGKLYLCLQSLYKIHPEMDRLFAGILKADPDAYLVLIEGVFASWRQALTQRWSDKLDLTRVIWLPRLSNQDFLGILKLGDVFLDTRPFGGGLTILQAYSLGIPVVSWPTTHAKGRFAQVISTQINWHEGLVQSAPEYIHKAIHFAHNHSLAQKADLQSRFKKAIDPQTMAFQIGQTVDEYLRLSVFNPD